MFAARSVLIFALLPLFAGCQMLASTPDKPSTAGMTRLQGDLIGENGQLLFQPCNQQRRYVVTDVGSTSVLQEAASLATRQGKLFADLRGKFVPNTTPGADGQLSLQQMYRVERPGPGAACDDPNFKRLTIRAYGNTPAWNVNVSGKGLVLERQGKDDLAVPYLEEQLPDGRFNLSTQANGQDVELWIAPQRCVDMADGSVQHLTAELRVNGTVQRGCAYYGGSRDD